MGKGILDRIKELDEYRPDISYKDGAFILKLRFKSGWTIIQPEDERVAYAKDEKVAGLHWYVSSIEDCDMIFDIVEETIAVNKDMEKKLLLYKEKVKELQDIFLSDIQYEKLITLQFTFPDTAKKGKGRQKTKQQVQEESNVIEQNEENTEHNIVEASVPTEIKTDELSDIDKKIAEALL